MSVGRCLVCWVILAMAMCSLQATEDTIELHLDAPLSSDHEALYAAGGIPFPPGLITSTEHLRLDHAGQEIPCQATCLASWPDGSMKWVLIEAVLTPPVATVHLTYGPSVQRSSMRDPITARGDEREITITGGGFHAQVAQDGAGILERLDIAGIHLITPTAPAEVVVETLRVAATSDDPPFATASTQCRDADAIRETSRCVIDAITLEATGPIRATVLLRGRLLLPHLGSTLPQEVQRGDITGALPFSMRESFIRGTAMVLLQHQLIYSGEPDRDVITHWGIRLPGLAGTQGLLCLEPGIVSRLSSTTVDTSISPDRLCYAPLSHGMALIRQGWENRPDGIRMEGSDAWIDCWPRAGGEMDLRRYAREWSAGESGDTRDAAAMKRYAPLAARGLAKSMEIVLDFGSRGPDNRARAIALGKRALLVATPAWYAASHALGGIESESIAESASSLEAMTRRRLDYQLYAQDLYGWYGSLVYGFWQSRFGQVHRNDRWDCDYGRWGWALADGGGRIGQVLMQEYLRTLDRRYFDAGEAVARITYDTNLVHTRLHLENAGTWWTASGCCHRHNVQPFGCPYIGMRGSYPLGQRLFYDLTGDGVIKDGLNLVAEAAMAAAQGHSSRLCDSGGSDGQGAAACALLWKAESSGDASYLTACRAILDASGLLPPKHLADIGYGAAFGIYLAAAEYELLTKDPLMRSHLLDTAALCSTASDDDAIPLLQVIAEGAQLSHDAHLLERLRGLLATLGTAAMSGLDDQPRATWPGHGGWKVPALDVNALRDLPWVYAALSLPAGTTWPGNLVPAAPTTPAAPPADWYHPGAAQGPADHPIDPTGLRLTAPAHAHAGMLQTGAALWACGETGIDPLRSDQQPLLRQPLTPYVEYLRHEVGVGTGPITERISSGSWQMEVRGGQLSGYASAGSTRFALTAHDAVVEQVHVLHVECRCQADGRPIVAWGLRGELHFADDAQARQVTIPGRFRLERCRMDQNDERIPNWLSAEYHWGEGAPLWPLWRWCGIELAPGPSYRVWHANAVDTAPVYVDQGLGSANWLDVTDRADHPAWGFSVRMLRQAQDHGAIRVDLAHGLIDMQWHSDASPNLPGAAHELLGSVDLVSHDGFRPPFAPPELTSSQYAAFIKDLEYDEITGLTALRFALSITHKVSGETWWEKIRDHGIEPREILYQMLYADSLAAHCQRLGVAWDAHDVEGSVQRIIEHYRQQ